MATFYPLREIESLRRTLLFSSADALRNGSAGGAGGEVVLWLQAAAGTALDIEVNVTWGGAAPVPLDFGSIGIKVLAVAPAPASSRLLPADRGGAAQPTAPTQAAAFGPHHGPAVTLAASTSGGRPGTMARPAHHSTAQIAISRYTTV